MPVLYRKYRPQRFAEVLNQKYIIQTLKNQVKFGGVAHAYLFTGSRGVGKTSVARILAKAVNCLSENRNVGESEVGTQYIGDACGECNVCIAVSQNNFIDLVEIDAASNTSVENVRDLIEHVRFSPSLGRYKVFIIDEVHMLSKSAFNALLKTLEEPPKHAIFILATTEINKVPATIISRTQRFDFKALSETDIFSHLEKLCKEEGLELDKQILKLVAQNAEGSVRDALSLLDKILTLGSGASLEECQMLLGVTDIGFCENLLELIALGKTGEIPTFFQKLGEKGLDFEIFNKDFLEYLRKALIFKVSEGGITHGLNLERLNKLKEILEKFSSQDLIFITRLFLKSFKDLKDSPNQEVPLLVSGIEAASRKAGAGVSENLNTVKSEAKEIITPKIESETRGLKTQENLLEENVNSNMSLEQMLEIWPKVIAKIKDVNGPLASLLKNSLLVGVVGGRVVLQAKFNFDKQSIENSKNTALIRSVIEALTGEKLGILAKVEEKAEKLSLTASEEIGQALKVFGGEIIE